MKTSNKLLIAAIALIVGLLVVHNYALKAEYLKGAYKRPHYQMKNLAITDFDAIEVTPAGWTNINITQGPKFSFWVNNDVKGLSIKKTGRTLIIDLANANENWSQRNISITCPQLKSFKTKPWGERFFDDIANVSLSGFKEDSMYVKTARAVTVFVEGCKVGQLTAVSDTSGGKLNIGVTNHITVADFNIQGPGELRLYAPVGDEKRTYKLSPNAVLALSNDALKLFPH